MTKKEFFGLLQKFENDTCTEVEKQLLYTYCEAVQVKALTASWELTNKEQARIRIFKRILKSVTELNRKKKRRKRRQGIQMAAVFGVLIASGLLFWHANRPVAFDQRSDRITLELEDGTIQVLDEKETLVLKGTNGKPIGTNTPQALVYDPSGTVREWVYHTLKVPYGKKFTVQLADGTIVHLNAGSSLRYPKQFVTGAKREVFITGEAFFEVTKDEVHPFVVNAGELDVEVLGTKFNVQAYTEDPLANIVLVAGAVSLTTEDTENTSTHSLRLQPGEMGSFDRSQNTLSKAKVTTEVYTSWMHGQLVFRNMAFAHILKKLERHYNITIVNKNKELAREKFSASFDAVPVEQVFKSLETYHGIHYTQKQDTLFIE